LLKNLFERALLSKTAAKPSISRKNLGDFHAVEIVNDDTPCVAAQQLAEMRFLSREHPPTLPLRTCDSPGGCTCRYRHHEDRRREGRRYTDNVWAGSPTRPPQFERRKSGDRRRSPG
jgi:hypothetical protein